MLKNFDRRLVLTVCLLSTKVASNLGLPQPGTRILLAGIIELAQDFSASLKARHRVNRA